MKIKMDGVLMGFEKESIPFSLMSVNHLGLAYSEPGYLHYYANTRNRCMRILYFSLTWKHHME